MFQVSYRCADRCLRREQLHTSEKRARKEREKSEKLQGERERRGGSILAAPRLKANHHRSSINRNCSVLTETNRHPKTVRTGVGKGALRTFSNRPNDTIERNTGPARKFLPFAAENTATQFPRFYYRGIKRLINNECPIKGVESK